MRRTYLPAAIGVFVACAVATVAAQAAGPPADYKLDAEYTATSPDGATTIEQYAKVDADGDYTW